MLKRVRLRGPTTLRRRLISWTAGIFSVTVGLLTVASIHMELRTLRQVEVLQASAWLGHLAEMPEFRGTSEEAQERLALLSSSLRSAGVRLELAGMPEPGGGAGNLATAPLSLREGESWLVYTTLPGRARRLVARTIFVHVVLGVFAVVAFTLATLWVLDRRLTTPLAEATHQLRRMAGGGGWQARLDAADGELQPLWSAVLDLGPGLEGQVEEWLGAERRAAAALAVQDLRETTRVPLRDGLAMASELQARGRLDAGAKRHVRVLVRRLEDALGAFDDRLQTLYGAGAPPSTTSPTAPPASPGTRPR